jgi:glucosyl-dolichyl phosphate glucuronosyltransferase
MSMTGAVQNRIQKDYFLTWWFDYGRASTVPKYAVNRNRGNGTKNAAMDAGLESATEILLEVLGLGDGWRSQGILPISLVAKTQRSNERILTPRRIQCGPSTSDVCVGNIVNITVILCTYNRCASLAKALHSIAAQTFPEPVEWEVLVVDNNSRDQTREVVKDFCRRYPYRFRYLFEPRQGKSYALNSGIQEARGDVLAFIDDDVTVESNWLRNLTAGLCSGEWAGAGGRILPIRGFVPPRWLALDGPRSLAGALFAYWDPGGVPGELQDPPYGANMAFRKEMFDRYGHFRTDLGPFPDSKIGFEDTEFGRRLIAGGECLRYVPSAIVYHEIDGKRVRKGYFLAWWFDLGRGSVRETGKSLSTREILKVLARTLLTTQRWVLTVDSQRRFYRKCRIWYEVGKIVEVYQQAKGANARRTQSEAAGGGRV